MGGGVAAPAGRLDTGAVLAWGVPRLRDLPWRRTRDPWAVLVSEVMLQQTQVARVVPRWHAFLAAYPTPAACAAAPLADVLRAWHGLGYPRRARALHAAAGAIARRGSFPDTIVDLLALPGIGPYTARAVLTFAFERDVAVVDTNIARVHARVAGRRLTAGEVQAAADASLAVGDSWAWNQSVMDLGATVCRPVPRCGECPLRVGCRWLADGGADPAPGSAGVSGRQARYEGSERQARGKVMGALVAGPVAVADVAALIGHDEHAAARVVAGLVADGLAELTDPPPPAPATPTLHLPGQPFT